jgi:hypothetical protein
MSHLNCIYCGKEFDGRSDAKYCSATCRQGAKREQERLDSGNLEPVIKRDVKDCPSPHAIDIAYWNHRKSVGLDTSLQMGSSEKVCVNEGCKKKFSTRLKLMRFCSPECFPFELK